VNEPLEELPTGWTSATIDDLCIINPKHDPSLRDDLQVTFVPMAAVSEHSGAITAPEVRPYGLVKRGFTHFADDDVIWAKITPCMENGKAAVARSLTNRLACGSTEFFVFRSKGAISPDYLYEFIRQESYRRAARKTMQSGVGQARVPKEFVADTEMPLPPLAEQVRIVERLFNLKSRSRNAREALEAVGPLLEQFRRSVLAAAFRGDLTADWRAAHADTELASVLLARIRQERRQKWEQVEMAKMKAKGKKPTDDKWKERYEEPEAVDESDLPELPERWCWASIDECTDWVTDGEHATPKRTSSGIELLSARNVQDGYISVDDVDYVSEETYESLTRRLLVAAGDVLLSCSGSVGRCCVVPDRAPRYAFVRSVAILRPVIGMGEFISLALRSPQMQNQITATKTQTAQANLFQGKIKRLAIPLAPLGEHREITRRLTTALASIRSLDSQRNAIVEEISFIDQSILVKAFRGDLVPQDPADEPASALLERVRIAGEAGERRENGDGARRKRELNRRPGVADSNGQRPAALEAKPAVKAKQRATYDPLHLHADSSSIDEAQG
jgi:type I restriction enzyme S subunit